MSFYMGAIHALYIYTLDRLPELVRWGCLARSGFPAVSRKDMASSIPYKKPLLNKLVR